MKETTLREMMAKKPERVIELAVKGMLPKGPLGRSMMTKLHVYAGPDHEQAGSEAGSSGNQILRKGTERRKLSLANA